MAVYYLLGNMPTLGAENIRTVLANPTIWDNKQGRWVPDPQDLEPVTDEENNALTIDIDLPGTPDPDDFETRAWLKPKLTSRTKILIDPYRQQFGLMHDWVSADDAAPDLDMDQWYEEGFWYTIKPLRDASILGANDLPGIDKYRLLKRRFSKKTLYRATIAADWQLRWNDAGFNTVSGVLQPEGTGVPTYIAYNNGETRYVRISSTEGFSWNYGVVLLDSDDYGPSAVVMSGTLAYYSHDIGLLGYNQYFDPETPMLCEFDVQNRRFNIAVTQCSPLYDPNAMA